MDRRACIEADSAMSSQSEVESDSHSGQGHVPGVVSEGTRRFSESLPLSFASRSCIAGPGEESPSESSVPAVAGSTASCERSFTTIHAGLTASCECPVCRRQCTLSLEQNETNHLPTGRFSRYRGGPRVFSSRISEQAQTEMNFEFNLRDVHMVAAFTRRSMDRGSASYAALSIWEQEHYRKARDPEYFPRIAAGVRISDYQAEFIRQITPALFKFYMCRQVTCLMVSRDSDWIQTLSGGKYKCMFCGSIYRPWKSTSNTVRSNTVVIFGADSHCGGISDELDEVGNSDSLSHQGKSRYMIPLQWSPTIVLLAVGRFMEVTLVLDTKMKRLRGDDRAQITYVSNILRGNVREVFFTDIRTDPCLRVFLELENRLKAGPSTRFDLDRCWKEIVRGSMLNIETHQLNSPLGIDDSIELWWACMFYRMNVA